MVITPTASYTPLDRLSFGRPAANQVPAASSDQRTYKVDESLSASRVTLSGREAAPAVYSDPRALGGARLWAVPVTRDDNVSALMARNRGLSSYTLSDQWRGLGGALLRRLAETGEGFSQTLVDDIAAGDTVVPGISPEEQAEQAAQILLRRTAALSDVATSAPTAGMKIQTRSGQTIELKIAVSTGGNGPVGMKVEISASGTLSNAERDAVERLADGLDRALEGLGRQDAAVLDLSGLMDYNRDVLASLDVSISNPFSHTVLDNFALRLGDDKLSVAVKGSDGDMNLTVAAGALTGKSSGQQQGQALKQALDRMTVAGERGRANAALVEQMKTAFKEFQLTATSRAGLTESADAMPAPQAPERAVLNTTTAQPAALAKAGGLDEGGLADFEASFGGNTLRLNRSGSANEAGVVQYQLSQKTTATTLAGDRQTVTKTVSEQLSADYRKAPGDAMLNVANGNFAAMRIRDHSVVTTFVDSIAGRPARALRRSDTQESMAVTDFQNHRPNQRQSQPLLRNLVERVY